MASASFGLTSFVRAFAASIGNPDARVALAGVTVAEGSPNARYADVALFGQTVALVTQSVADTSLAGVTVAYTVGAPDVFTQRAFPMTFDGHPFYVLHLGQEGTFVFDMSTRQWSQFQTEGYDTWNFEASTVWNGFTVGGSLTDGSIWKIVPTGFLDEDWRAIERIVTGGFPMRARKSVTNFGLIVSGAVGDIEADSDSSIKLEISDDNGANFIDVGTIDLTTDTKQELAWLSLGKITAPGRIYRITDTGALKRIDDAENQIEGEDDNPDDK